jgi:DNA-directed RNA polymerase subunit RPC12/RpoP
MKARHPQTQQYAIRALKKYPGAAGAHVQDLRDLARNPAQRDYVRAAAATTADAIAQAVADVSTQVKYRCQRCNAQVSAEEHARSQQAFQRVYCDRCFDEVFLERRNFETQVEINKTIEARDGTIVQSVGERRIAEWLTAQGIAYRYDAKFRIIAEFQIRPDFYLPELDVYVEYWGLDTPQYKMSMYKKQTLYQQEGKRLISVYPPDLPRLDGLLAAKLRLFGFCPPQ